jgi:dihydroxy-acid dehydratase
MPHCIFPRLPHEAGIRFTLDDVAVVFERTPLIGNLRPAGDYHAQDVYRVGGVPMIAKALIRSGHIDGQTPTIGGETLAQACSGAPDPDGEVIRAPNNAISPAGGVVVLKGNLAPNGALLKVPGLVSPVHEGPARVFENEEECMAVIRARAYGAGDVLVIRNEGPKGGPGMREMLGPTGADLRSRHGRTRGARHRWALLRRNPRHVCRLCLAGSRRRRPDRLATQRRPRAD